MSPTIAKNQPEGMRRSSILDPTGLRCLFDLAVANAGRADANPLGGALDDGPHRLQVQIPAALGDIVGVTDLVAELGTAATHIANSCHYRNLLSRHCIMCGAGLRPAPPRK